jgi:glycosyltransferase involved in cell wall biosynthesis
MILIIGPFPLPVHGCSLANEILLNQLKKNSAVEVSIINTNSENVSSKEVGKFSVKKILSFLKSYKNLALIRRADIVYTTPGQTFYGIAKYIPFYSLCLKYKVPYIIHVHGNHLGNEYKELKGFKNKIFKHYISKAAGGIVLSASLKDNFEGLLPADKVFVVENFAQDNLTEEAVIDKPVDMVRLLYLSNLMKEKGILDFLIALSKLKADGLIFKADIAGKIEDESTNEIRQRLEELKDCVTYHGIVHGQAKIDLLKNSNVFILPTYYKMEGQPIALIEAMATGNILLTTKHAGIPDIVSAENGFFVEKQNSESICKTILQIKENLEENIKFIGAYNMKYVKDNFSEEQFANKILYVVSKTQKV